MQNFKGAVSDGVDAWALAVGLCGQKTASLSVAFVLALLRAVVGDVVRLKKLARWGLAGRMLGGLVVSYVDMLSDVLVAVQFLTTAGLDKSWATWTFGPSNVSQNTWVHTGGSAVFAQLRPEFSFRLSCSFCDPMTGSLAFSLVVQALVAFLFQPGKGRWREVVLALCGVKPLVETWRMLTGAPSPPGSWPTEWLLSVSRIVEVLCESLPQAALQAYVFLQTPEPTNLQFVSLFGSLAAAGYILAMVDYDLDTSARYRRSEPTQYGLFPTRSAGERHAERRAACVFLGDMLFVAGSLACRAVAVAVALTVTHASSSGPALVPLWLAVEYALFNLARVLLGGSWHFFARSADGPVFGLMMNLTSYLVCTAAPILLYRMPFIVMPHIWSGSIVTAALSNFALLGAAFHLAGGGGEASAAGVSAGAAFTALAACAGVQALGCVLIVWNMVPRYRPTLWRWRTARQHVALSLWRDCPPSAKFGSRPVDSRARTLKTYSLRYWPPKDVVVAWVNEHWASWQAEETKPEWFDEWTKIFPPGWLPDDGTPTT